MKDRKILIIGGSGFLGCTIATKLGKCASIADLVLPTGDIDNTFIRLDLLKESNLVEIFKGYDIVINCTGQITNLFQHCLNLNTKGVNNIVNAINELDKTKLIQVSTVAVYGTTDNANEKTPLNPETPYATAKAVAEFIISNSYIQNYCIIRIPNLYGETQQKGVFSYFKRSLQSDRKLFFVHNGSLLRYYLHVDDVAEAIINAVKHDLSGVFNLTSNDRFTISELIQLIENSHNIKFDLHLGTNRHLENIEILDGSKFTSLTTFLPSKSVQDYIEKMLK
ncbi:MAG: NAD(P)-dependent oxidoreductase [Bacteroidetes bacterium]|nr:NAD(P)-dependent oxidoreductase [Bacteroidota bacterium]